MRHDDCCIIKPKDRLQVIALTRSPLKTRSGQWLSVGRLITSFLKQADSRISFPSGGPLQISAQSTIVGTADVYISISLDLVPTRYSNVSLLLHTIKMAQTAQPTVKVSL